MKTSNNPQFNRYYDLHCKHLRLKGLQSNNRGRSNISQVFLCSFLANLPFQALFAYLLMPLAEISYLILL